MEPREFVAYHQPALGTDASVCELRNWDTSKEPE